MKTFSKLHHTLTRSVFPDARWSALAISLALLLVTQAASARKLIDQPGAHPRHSVELEPHAHVRTGNFRHPGIGIRATWVVADRGFITKVNDSFGIGFGGDYTFDLHRCDRNRCRRNGELIVPVAAIWSFWFTEKWSAFGEAGVYTPLLHPVPDGDFFLHPDVAVGGRFMISDSVSLTLRIGAPVTSFGFSFFL